MTLRESRRLRRREGVAWRLLQGEAVLVSAAEARVHSLNEVGTRFWQLCDGTRSADEIALSLVGEFECSAEDLLRDCRVFARDLTDRGLLE